MWERAPDGGGTQAVLRFIAPGIAAQVGPEAALADLDWLCRTHAVPIAALPATSSDSVVVTMMDRPVSRGTTDPAATQYFQFYVIEDGECLPEEF